MARRYGVARSEASRLKDELRTRELEIELLQQELQQRDVALSFRKPRLLCPSQEPAESSKMEMVSAARALDDLE